MTIRDRAKRRPQFETLEARETPSSFAHHAVVHAVKFTGSGGATAATEATLAGGTIELTGPASGTSAQLGAFSGTGVTDLTTSRKFTSSLVIQTSPGNTLTLTTHGSYNKKGLATSPFKLVNGTGQLAGYSGSGTLKTTINFSSGSLAFSFSGTYKP